MSNIPESNTNEYGSYLDEIISELMTIKNTLKRGSTRKENRKEVASLQSAINSLRHLKRKNERQVLLKNNREKGLNESFGYDDIKNFLLGREPDEN